MGLVSIATYGMCLQFYCMHCNSTDNKLTTATTKSDEQNNLIMTNSAKGNIVNYTKKITLKIKRLLSNKGRRLFFPPVTSLEEACQMLFEILKRFL